VVAAEAVATEVVAAVAVMVTAIARMAVAIASKLYLLFHLVK
jgi:hypothetical protein